MSTETNSPPSLSERELQVLRLVATGATNNQIARELTISANTVKVHLNNIFSKLGVQSRTEAALYAVRQGWVEMTRPESTSVNDARVPSTPVADAVSAVQPQPVEPNPPAPSPSVSAPTAEPAQHRPLLRQRVLVTALVVGLLLGLMIYPLASSTDAWRNYFGARVVVNPPVPTAPPRWAMKAALPSAREAMAVASFNGLVYAIGGVSEGKVLDGIDVYDPTRDAWNAKAHKPTAVQGSGAAIIGGRMYVPGGCDANDRPTSVLEVYDPARDAWQSSVALPKAICHYAISAIEGRLYLFGGWDGSNVISRVFAFDPMRGEWNERAPLPSPRADAAASVVNDRVFVVGGRNGERVFGDVFVYDPTADAWLSKTPMLHARAQFGLVALAGNLYALSGGWANALPENERYDTQTDKWSLIENAPEPLERVGGAAALETKIYLVGGRRGRVTASVQEYTALYRFFVPSVPAVQ